MRFKVVPNSGLEPERFAALVLEASVSTNSTSSGYSQAHQNCTGALISCTRWYKRDPYLEVILYYLRKEGGCAAGDANGIRTRATAVKGQCLDRLTMAPYGGADGTRTRDPLLAKQVFYQLNYNPVELMGDLNPRPADYAVNLEFDIVVEASGVEPESAYYL